MSNNSIYIQEINEVLENIDTLLDTLKENQGISLEEFTETKNSFNFVKTNLPLLKSKSELSQMLFLYAVDKCYYLMLKNANKGEM